MVRRARRQRGSQSLGPTPKHSIIRSLRISRQGEVLKDTLPQKITVMRTVLLKQYELEDTWYQLSRSGLGWAQPRTLPRCHGFLQRHCAHWVYRFTCQSTSVWASQVRSGEEPTCQCRRHEFSPWAGKIPWRRAWQPTPVFLPGKLHEEGSLAGYSPLGRNESDTTERLNTDTISINLSINIDHILGLLTYL